MYKSYVNWETGSTDLSIISIMVIEALRMVETTQGVYIEKNTGIPKVNV